MNSQNSLSHIILAYKKTSFAFIFFISFTLLSFKTQNVEALFIPTLSASADQANLQVNGNQVINSTNKTIEIPLNLTINTNNRTGYTATLSAETENTALTNNNSTTGAKIDSVSTNLPLGNLPNNSWGYKFGSSTNYAPIPALSTPAQILQTSGKTNGNESNQLSIGMKLSDNLESGRYTNKLIFSILTNNYDRIAVITEGPDFNTKLKSLETTTNKIEHFKKGTVAPAVSMSTVNIDDEYSDYEIKLWLDPADKTAYYYVETEKVYLNADSSEMFFSKYGEQKIKNILDLDLSNFDTSQVTNMSSMFRGMSNLTTLNLSNFDTSQVTNMDSMLASVSNLTTIDLSSFDTSKVTDISAMFYDLSNLITLNLSNFDTSRVTNMQDMFYGMRNLTTIDLSSFDTSKVTRMRAMFYGMRNLTTLNLSSFDTSKVTDMSLMFYNMSSLTTLNLSNFDTSQVINMYSMFDSVSNLTTLDLSNFDTSKVTNMSSMFNNMTNLTSLNVSSFNTENVENMSGMFSQVQKLEHLNLSHFRTDKVTNMGSMFYQMIKLKTIDLSHFNTANVTDMSSMFSMDDNLTELDLRSFTTPKVENFGYMFASFTTDNRLTRIYTSGDWDISRAVSAGVVAPKNVLVFANRVNLVGNNGWSSSTPNNVGLEALRIDRSGAPGYFTLRP
mgnify:FL=1|jgi:bacterial surface protein 26-residue repeat/bacterial surface protein 26-residue repeat/bacterial surface protein 26-residue repeat/bacterial surface protein 26-residue repeat/bacterial surface protein 26-residue repeat/bacterial surface protein 26-residue repeat/bacterial surface protein 26-residue repeat/bacterial surface protein 26-residue repeat/bacterial surface protein 26-residue repeat/bacterial surface protein 26-residue repeat/bacterial surface protein 26-residue repeat